MVDAPDSGSGGRKAVLVRVQSRAPQAPPHRLGVGPFDSHRNRTPSISYKAAIDFDSGMGTTDFVNPAKSLGARQTDRKRLVVIDHVIY